MLDYSFEDKLKKTAGKRISKLLADRKISIAKFCRDLEIPNRQTYYNWKKGKNAPETLYLYKISEYFGVSIDYLTGQIPCEKNEQLDIVKDTGLCSKAISNIQRLHNIGHNRCFVNKDDNKNPTFRNELDDLNSILSDDSFIRLLHIIHEYKKACREGINDDTMANLQAMIGRKFLKIIEEI